MTPATSAETTTNASLIAASAGNGASRDNGNGGNVAGGRGPVDCVTRET
jgi:hypothetical protein